MYCRESPVCDWPLRKGWISLPVKAEASCWRRQKKSGKPSLEIYTFLLMKSMEWKKGISGLRTAQRSPASLWSPALFEDMARMWFLPVSEKRSKKGAFFFSSEEERPALFLGENPGLTGLAGTPRRAVLPAPSLRNGLQVRLALRVPQVSLAEQRITAQEFHEDGVLDS